jgi:hypothetical protein
MTEAEWLTCTDPQQMLEFVKNLSTWRKLRLFLCAHLRMTPFSPTHAFRSQLADVLERLADGLPGSEKALTTMIQEMKEFQWSCIQRQDFERAAYLRECFDLLKLARQPDTVMGLAAGECDCPILHDLFGNNPFQPITFNPASLTPTVANLAQAIYEESAFDCLPLLADALDEAGCTNNDILRHCRQQGKHVKGCWLVDLLLDKR